MQQLKQSQWLSKSHQDKDYGVYVSNSESPSTCGQSEQKTNKKVAILHQVNVSKPLNQTKKSKLSYAPDFDFQANKGSKSKFDGRLHLKEARLNIEEALGTCLLPLLELIPANLAVGQEIWVVLSILPYEARYQLYNEWEKDDECNPTVLSTKQIAKACLYLVPNSFNNIIGSKPEHESLILALMIEAEEMSLDVSDVVISSTRQDIDECWWPYDSFDHVLEKKLYVRIRRNVSCYGSIMAAGSRDRPPMLATGRYTQWRSRFLRYIDARPNGDALRKCILEGPYTLSTVVVLAVPATENSLSVPEHTTIETLQTMSPENKAHYESEKEAIHLILTGIGDEIYSTIDACKIAQET
nr:THO complex subunit 2 isoform X1 [Tanacetum cinerariifolium]